MRVATAVLRPLLVLPLFLLLAGAPSAQRDSAFMQEYRKLQELDAQDEMAALMRKNETPAILAIIETCELIGMGSSDSLEDDIASLGKTWKKVYANTFVDKQYEYHSLGLEASLKKQRIALIDRYVLKYKEYAEAEKAKDTGKLPALGLEFNNMGAQLVDLGDHYMAAQCFRVYASCFDDRLMGNRADFKRACEGWVQFVKEREACDLINNETTEARERAKLLESDGFGGEPEPAAGEAAAPAPAAATVPLATTFELVSDIEALVRPSFTGDTNYQIWNAVGLAKEGSTGRIPSMSDDEVLSIVRTGAAKAAVDVDGDGKGDVDIPITGKITPVQVTLGKGDQARPWAFLAVVGQERDTYQGFAMNLAPDVNQMAIYVAPAASLVGLVDGVRVQVIDDNMDGRFGTAPKDWAYIGTLDGAFQHDIDSIAVGESKAARPWSKLQKIGPAWYTLAEDSTGRLVTARTEVKSGTLQLDLKGLNASWMIVRGTGEKNDLFYDVANGGTNKVEVPEGTYELYMGQVATGKKAQMMKALVLPGAGTTFWRVKAGETVKMELGAPFGFTFSYAQDEKTVTVNGPSVGVVGRGSEVYQRFWNCVPVAEVLMRKAGTKKGKEEGKIQPATSQEQIQQDFNNDYKAVWFPVGRALDKPNEGETVEVQLFEKKNRLFGKIESDWRAN